MTVLPAALQNLRDNRETFRDASRVKNFAVLRSLLGPAFRGFVRQAAKGHDETQIRSAYDVNFTWTYERNRPDMAKLHEQAKKAQWDSDDLPWDTSVDPGNMELPLVPDSELPFSDLPSWQKATKAEQTEMRRSYTAWLLSQFLHGEQGALFAACQVTTAVSWMDGKLYGSTQVVDEGRHVEVFHKYLTTKLGKKYEINDNLYVIIDALMTDSRWDLKFLGMQIMIEGLALGAFGYLRKTTGEPLLEKMLRMVITDEARHVHFGVLSLHSCYNDELSEKEKTFRQDWAYEMALLLRNRFLLQEFYEEHFAHAMTLDAWKKHILASRSMTQFRTLLFRRMIPNFKKIGLLPDRLRPHYQAIGLLDWESGLDATRLQAADLLE
jgi:hypothetical protein